MAESATPGSVNRDQSNIDYAKAVELIRTTVHTLESEQRSLSADAKDAWDRVEQLGVNKVGAQLFSKILKKPVEKRQDEFRTLVNLAKAAGWFDWLNDLVDQSQTAPLVAPAPAAPAAPKANVPAANREAPPPPAGDTDLAAGPVERVNLKSGWIQRLKPSTGDGAERDLTDDKSWDDHRQATPKELAAERERLQADFDGPAADGPKPEPEVAAGKDAARKSVGDRRKLSVAGGTDSKK